MFPENSWPAFEHALNAGVDVLELDVGVTKDLVAVIHHDRRLNTSLCDARHLGGRQLLIKDYLWNDLKSVDCGASANPRFPKQARGIEAKLMSLAEFFALVAQHPRGKQIEFNIETKTDPMFSNETIDAELFTGVVVEEIRRGAALNRSMLQSFDLRTLAAARRLAPELRRVVLNSDHFQDSLSLAKLVDAWAISPHWAFVDARYVRRAHRAGVRVIPWTANTRLSWRKMSHAGVDGIISDDPAALISWLAHN